MQLISSAFASNTSIPTEYTCKGSGFFPPLHFENALPGTQSLALILHDPDSPRGDFVHWLVWNIDPAVNEIRSQDGLPAQARQGLNDFGTIGYGAPCPHTGTHRYIFELYALNVWLENVPQGANRAALEKAMQRCVIAHTQLIGIVSA